MFLAIDAGNSNVVFALFDEKTQKWTNQFRLETKTERLISQLSKKVPLYFLEHDIHPKDIKLIGFSSVVPEIQETIQQFCESFFGRKAYVISAKSYKKLPVVARRPNEIGTDLMCNVMAAWEKFHQPFIVVDFGTALTFTVVDEKGQVLGVNIVPGLQTAIKALFMNTSKLPEVSLEFPESAIGQDTIHAIQAGILHGYTGLVKGMLQTIRNEKPLPFKIIATGGLSAILTTLRDEFEEIDRYLTLDGIRLITQINQA